MFAHVPVVHAVPVVQHGSIAPPQVRQAPAPHTWPVVQTVVQPPQWAALLEISTQAPLQVVSPAAQAQPASTQNSPPLQATPQPPQLALSLKTLAQ